MPRINLLPVKAARRLDAARREMMVYASALGFILLVLVYWYMVTAHTISSRRNHIASLHEEITSLDKLVGQVDTFKQRAGMLERKLQIIEDLKKRKVGSARVLDDLATKIGRAHV